MSSSDRPGGGPPDQQAEHREQHELGADQPEPERAEVFGDVVPTGPRPVDGVDTQRQHGHGGGRNGSARSAAGGVLRRGGATVARPKPRRAADVDDGQVPQWVIDSNSSVAAIRRLSADPSLVDGLPSGVNPIWAELQRTRQAAQEWCRARGLSYAMTVSGAAKPAPGEVAVGCTRGVGPRYEATQTWLREHQR